MNNLALIQIGSQGADITFLAYQTYHFYLLFFISSLDLNVQVFGRALCIRSQACTKRKIRGLELLDVVSI